MRVEITEMLWFEEHAVTLPELSELCALPISLLEELVSAGVIVPLESSVEPVRFGAQALNASRVARRLHRDFDLDSSALVVALGLLERVAELEKEVEALRARLPASIHR